MSSNSTISDDTIIVLAVAIPVGVFVCLVVLIVGVLCSWWCCLFTRRRRRARKAKRKKSSHHSFTVSFEDVSSSRQGLQVDSCAAGSDRSSHSEEAINQPNRANCQPCEPYFNTTHCKPKPSVESGKLWTTIRSNASDKYYTVVSSDNKNRNVGNSCAGGQHPANSEETPDDYYTTMSLDRDVEETTADTSEEYYTTMNVDNDISEHTSEHRREEGQDLQDPLLSVSMFSTNKTDSSNLSNLDRRGTVDSEYENTLQWTNSSPHTPTSPEYANIYDSVTLNPNTVSSQRQRGKPSSTGDGYKGSSQNYSNLPSDRQALQRVTEDIQYI